jgi:tetratricopeptide (TPR) repeat protein
LPRAALWSSNQRKIEISRTVRERVTAALALSPDDDVALHILGRWEYEMSCVGFAVRMVVKMVYGGLEVGSLAEAHRCLARAIELRPERLVHRVVMARILQKMGQQEEAVRQLEAALSLQVEDVNAEHERAEATRMLLRMGRPVQFAAAAPRPSANAAAPPPSQQAQPQQPAPQARRPADASRCSEDGARRSLAATVDVRRTRSEDGGSSRPTAAPVLAAACC